MVRPYVPSDQPQLLQLIRLNTPQYFAPEEERDFLHYLENQREDYFVLDEEGQLLGCGGINYSSDGKTAIISWDMIHPHRHGQGLGKQLVQYRLELIRSQPEIERIRVRTSQLTYRFYQKFGFELIKIQKDYWAKGLDLYHMEQPK